MLDRIRSVRVWRPMPSCLLMKPGCFPISFAPGDPAEVVLRTTVDLDDADQFERYDESTPYVGAFARLAPER